MITLPRDAVSEALARLSGVIDDKGTIACLSMVRLTWGASLEVAATDLDLSLRILIPHDAPAGSAVLPWKRLNEIMALAPADVVLLPEKDWWYKLTSKRSSYRLAGIHPEDYPELPGTGGEAVTLPGPVLSRLLKLTRKNITKENANLYIAGMQLGVSPESITATATDGSRMLRARVTGTFGPFILSILIPRAAVDCLIRLVGDEPVVVAYNFENHLSFTSADWALTTKKIDSVFPAVDRPLSWPALFTAGVDAAEFEAAIRRALVISKDAAKTKWVRLAFTQTTLTVTASSASTGESSEEIDCVSDGVGTIGFNADYLLDYLGLKLSTRVDIGVGREGDTANELTSIRINATEGDLHTTTVIMGMRP